MSETLIVLKNHRKREKCARNARKREPRKNSRLYFSGKSENRKTGMGSNDGPCVGKHEYGTENENRRAKNCAKCEKVKIYIVKRSKNANNSGTRRNFKILTSDSDSWRGITSTMRFRSKSETKNFSTFRGGAGRVAARKSKNKSHFRGP